MSKNPNLTSSLPNDEPKSFLTSKTIWGAVLTAAVAIIPIAVSMLQFSPPCVNKPGQLTCDQELYNKRVTDIGQIVLIILTTTLTVVGRVTVTQPIAILDGM